MKNKTLGQKLSPWQQIASHTAEGCKRSMHRQRSLAGLRKKALNTKAAFIGKVVCIAPVRSAETESV